jgi:ATP adenylyltransferase
MARNVYCFIILLSISLYSSDPVFCVDNNLDSEDHYDILYAPWRGNSCVTSPNVKAEWKKACPFCNQFSVNEDGKHYILKRLKHSVIMLNLHPYAPGHIMIVPYQHVPELKDLTQEARIELIESLSLAAEILKNSLHYHGVNIGINIGGKGTGGSIPDHIHVHIIPRWEGDNNFMAAVAGTRIMNCDMGEIYKHLAIAFKDFKVLEQ